jgi:negative regulator of flagellin synthesis FlgM
MKINGIGPSKVISIYNNNNRVTSKKEAVVQKDSLEISSAGRSLSSFALDGNYVNSPEKLEALKTQISQGTYKPDAKHIAQKMIDIIKRRDI